MFHLGRVWPRFEIDSFEGFYLGKSVGNLFAMRKIDFNSLPQLKILSIKTSSRDDRYHDQILFLVCNSKTQMSTCSKSISRPVKGFLLLLDVHFCRFSPAPPKYLALSAIWSFVKIQFITFLFGICKFFPAFRKFPIIQIIFPPLIDDYTR